MLFLSRKAGEAIVINNDITLIISEIRSNSVKLSFDYSPPNQILRKEVFDRIQHENKAAAASTEDTIRLINSRLSGIKLDITRIKER